MHPCTSCTHYLHSSQLSYLPRSETYCSTHVRTAKFLHAFSYRFAYSVGTFACTRSAPWLRPGSCAQACMPKRALGAWPMLTLEGCTAGRAVGPNRGAARHLTTVALRVRGSGQNPQSKRRPRVLAPRPTRPGPAPQDQRVPVPSATDPQPIGQTPRGYQTAPGLTEKPLARGRAGRAC